MKTPQTPHPMRSSSSSSSILRPDHHHHDQHDPHDGQEQRVRGAGAHRRRRLSRRPSLLVDLETKLNSRRNSHSHSLSSPSSSSFLLEGDNESSSGTTNRRQRRPSKRLSNSSLRGSSNSAPSIFSSSSSSSIFRGSFRTNKKKQQQQEEVVTEEENEKEERHRVVRFDSVHVRTYKIHVDDNPAVSTGPAIALFGWDYTSEPILSLDEYEEAHHHHHCPPRVGLKDLKMSRAERERMLLQAGASRAQMQRFVKRINVAKRKRLQTLETLSNLPKGAPEAMEGASRRILRLLGLRRSVDQDVAEIMSRVPVPTAAATPAATTRKPWSTAPTKNSNTTPGRDDDANNKIMMKSSCLKRPNAAAAAAAACSGPDVNEEEEPHEIPQ